MVRIKNTLLLFIFLLSISFIGLNYDKINEEVTNYVEKAFQKTPTVEIKQGNAYAKTNTFLALKQVENYIPSSKEDIINIFYSILNQGWEEFTFYCDEHYTSCIEDIASISNDEELLGNINNYVHPYNSYMSIKTSYDDTGEITISVKHLYTETEQKELDREIEKISEELALEGLPAIDQVTKIHDYIINTTKYDVNKADGFYTSYDSSRAGGVLFDHYSVCSGYADTLAIFLSYFGIPNFKVSSATHIWNVVYIDDAWLHVDATWDDPVSKTGEDTLTHTYFLLTSSKLQEQLESYEEHAYDINFYKEI